MKKIFVVFGLLALFSFNITAQASCSCTSEDILQKVANLKSYEKRDLLHNLLWWSDNSTKSLIVDEIKDTIAFRRALKDYINNSCSISNNRIICR